MSPGGKETPESQNARRVQFYINDRGELCAKTSGLRQRTGELMIPERSSQYAFSG